MINATANAGWLHLAPSFDWYGYRDRSGVLHAWQADAARYETRDYQVQIRGCWLSVGKDVYRLTDFH
jgi:hypothetical protein